MHMKRDWNEFTIEMKREDGKNEPIVVSACLVGLRCRYNGKVLDSEIVTKVLECLKGRWFVPICPEQLGGLPTVRFPMEIEHGQGEDVLDGKARVIDSEGFDRTAEMVRGAREAYRIAELTGARIALLKDGSPSCGSHLITRKGGRVEGMGVAAALFKRQGMVIMSESDLAGFERGGS